MKNILLLLLCYFFHINYILFAQGTKDSLRTILRVHPPQDTLYILTLAELANELRYDMPDSSLLYATKALLLAQKANYIKGIGRASRVVGVCYRNKGKHDEALKFLKLSADNAAKIADTKGLALTYNSIAAIYKNVANTPLAIEYCQYALKEFEILKDKKGIAYVMNNLADAYLEQGDYDKALQYAEKSLKYNEEIKDNKGIFYSTFNISEIYRLQKQHSKALSYQLRNIVVAEKNADKSDIIYACNQIANSYMALYDYPKAYPYLERALQLSLEINNDNRTALSYTNLAKWHKNQKELTKALVYAEKALQLSKELKNINFIYAASLEHSEIAHLLGDDKTAYSSHVLHKQMADSLQNEKSIRATMQKEFAFKEEQQKLAQQKQELSHAAEIEQQKTVRNAVIVALVLMVIVAFLAYRSYYMKKKSNLLLEKQKIEIKIANDELNQVNEEMHQQQEELMMLNENLGRQKQELESTYQQLKITTEQLDQSIAYASNIQGIILPSLQDFLAFFQDAFVIYKPRDVVSGDFYWFAQINENQTVFALADCTGHGVPGAFMSMLGCTLLNEIVHTKHIYNDPARILRNLNAALQRILKQSTSDNRDGMDISVAYFEKAPDSTKKQLVYAGAKSQMYYVYQKELHAVNGDKLYLGGRGKQGEFTNQVFIFEEEVQCYFFTDGFADQNNPKRERFSSVKLKDVLQNLADLPPQVQQQTLLELLAQHQQEEKQRDDISVVYLRL